ncbi:MAG TPA: hypothetical protein VMF14_09720 [Solirubrobacteraceae bacterium]|nr:hypothetical protein [Solirubrobacteraceae bacterium]
MKRALAALGCATACLVAAGPAAADSMVFIKADNVWLANPDGSGQYQVTLDGTADSPYSSPSQADDGTVVALRTPAGGRPEIWRMSQNGGLLNAPINTPAPGTGAIDARVSPNGQLVAYWFVTEVSTGTCLYCFDVSSRALISHVDAFTNPDAVGTPNTGAHPSWMSNNTLLLSNGNATQWYYTLGTPEAAQWWGDTDNCGCANPVGLTDGVVSRDGQRIALVRGDSNETLVLYRANGAPPATPTPECAFTGPTGKFQNPTWASNGQSLAWQEDNGIWSAQVPDITNCATIGQPGLIVPGATEPSLGPAAIAPGPRPGCGNPGNPAACTGPPPPPPPPPPGHTTTIAQQLHLLVTALTRALKRLAIHGLLHRGTLSVAFTTPAAGKLTVTLSTKGRHPVVLASGHVTFAKAGKRTVTLALAPAQSARLRRVHRMSCTLGLRFAPTTGKATSVKSGVTLSK